MIQSHTHLFIPVRDDNLVLKPSDIPRVLVPANMDKWGNGTSYNTRCCLCELERKMDYGEICYQCLSEMRLEAEPRHSLHDPEFASARDEMVERGRYATQIYTCDYCRVRIKLVRFIPNQFYETLSHEGI